MSGMPSSLPIPRRAGTCSRPRPAADPARSPPAAIIAMLDVAHAAQHERDQQRDQHKADDAREHQRLKLRVLALVRLEHVPAARADRAGFGMLRRMDDHLILLLGDGDDRLALRAGALLAGKFIGHAESLQAARAGDVDGHGAEAGARSSGARSRHDLMFLYSTLLLLAPRSYVSFSSSSLMAWKPLERSVSTAISMLSTISATAGRPVGRIKSG